MNQLNPVKYPLLKKINKVGDIKKLPLDALNDLSQEIRQFLIDCTAKTGGHLSSNLGVVELTIALHFVLDLPLDEIVWDVGHQSYIHKILTERKEQMTTLRQQGGLSGFAKIKESQYDPFGAGHASTSISASLGIALAKKMQNDDGLTVAVIGDGAMTGGMAFEALNNTSLNPSLNLLIVLNDNKMSISENVGGITKTLSYLINSRSYRQFKNTSKKILENNPINSFSPVDLLQLAKKSEGHLKDLLIGSNLFEQLSIDYSGPIDGHNLAELIPMITDLKTKKGIRLLHIQTQKGKGIAEAEADPLKYHGIKAEKIDPQEIHSNTEKRLTYSQIFGKWLCNSATKYPKMIGVTPAMCQGSGMEEFAQKHPNQFFDVAIAEQHSMTFCAGFAAKGEKPVLAIYSTFLQRAYDQLIHDVAVQDLDITLAIDRAGIVGEDGPTHSGQFDLSFLRILPKMVLMTPSDEIEMIKMLNSAYLHKGLSAVRYPKGYSDEKVSIQQIEQTLKESPTIKIGKANIIRHSNKKQLAILCFGDLLYQAKKVAEEMDASLVDMRFIKPLDEKLILNLAKNHQCFATIEENSVLGGAGSFVSEFLNASGHYLPIKHLGIEDDFVDQGSRKKLLDEANLSQPKIKKILTNWLKELNKKKWLTQSNSP